MTGAGKERALAYSAETGHSVCHHGGVLEEQGAVVMLRHYGEQSTRHKKLAAGEGGGGGGVPGRRPTAPLPFLRVVRLATRRARQQRAATWAARTHASGRRPRRGSGGPYALPQFAHSNRRQQPLLLLLLLLLPLGPLVVVVVVVVVVLPLPPVPPGTRPRDQTFVLAGGLLGARPR